MLKIKKWVLAFVAVCSVLVLNVSALAVLPTPDPAIVTDMGEGIASIQTQVMSAIGAVIPYALAIMGIFLVWKFGLRFFRRVGK